MKRVRARQKNKNDFCTARRADGGAENWPPAIERRGTCLNWLGVTDFLELSPAMNESEQDQIVYKVVINQEEQYSIWPADRENAQGWRDVGKQGQKQECLDYINEVWKDMRPLRLRKQMDRAVGS